MINLMFKAITEVSICYLLIIVIKMIIDYTDKYYKNSNQYNEIKKKLISVSKTDKDLQQLIASEDSKRHWYTIHALANTFIVFNVLKDFYLTITDPLSSLSMTDDTLGLSMSLSLHLYHIITSMKTMDMIDWLHHLISCLFVGLISMFYLKCKLVNYMLFFICGLPGGIDYYLLAMTKYNVLGKMVEKRINVDLNMWIRLPGILYACFVGWIGIIYSKSEYNMIVVLLLIFLNYFNSVYFASRVVQNYGYCVGKSDDRKHNSDEHKVAIEIINNTNRNHI